MYDCLKIITLQKKTGLLSLLHRYNCHSYRCPLMSIKYPIFDPQISTAKGNPNLKQLGQVVHHLQRIRMLRPQVHLSPHQGATKERLGFGQHEACLTNGDGNGMTPPFRAESMNRFWKICDVEAFHRHQLSNSA